MPKGIKNKKINNPLDIMENKDLNDTSIDLAAKKTSKKVEASNKISDLKTKYPSRTLEDLRKIDYVNQYESKFPKIERPGFVIAWICNTPNKDNRAHYYSQGYDYVEGVEPVTSGYSDMTGEDKFAHFAMQIPVELYEKKQNALSAMTKKMYGHILKPDKKGREIDGDGMYDPKGREVKTLAKVLTPTQE